MNFFCLAVCHEKGHFLITHFLAPPRVLLDVPDPQREREPLSLRAEHLVLHLLRHEDHRAAGAWLDVARRRRLAYAYMYHKVVQARRVPERAS